MMELRDARRAAAPSAMYAQRATAASDRSRLTA